MPVAVEEILNDYHKAKMELKKEQQEYEWCECGDGLQTREERKTGVCSLCESLGRKRGVKDGL